MTAEKKRPLRELLKLINRFFNISDYTNEVVYTMGTGRNGKPILIRHVVTILKQSPADKSYMGAGKPCPFRKLMKLTNRLFHLRDFTDEVRYFVQRGFRGYSERDCWAIDDYLDKLIPELLRWLKENNHGFSSEFLDTAFKERGGIPDEYNSPNYTDADRERGRFLFNNMIDAIIAGFDAHHEINSNGWDHSDQKAYKEKEDKCRATFKKGMRLLTKYYDILWD
ncbi:MAG: hypothetical protein HQM09_17545 [Candidatus Riflebacteria bacterium]|nr:hypothetical protein [Candidatus Riflebacteria bacterium]